MSRLRRSGGAAAVVTMLCAGALTACSWQGDDPSQDAKRFAQALERGEHDAVTFSRRDDAASLLNTTLGPLGTIRPEVTVNKVTEDGNGRSTADLGFSWDLGSGEDDTWTYTTRVPMELTGDTWRPVWSPAIVAPLTEGETLRVNRTAPPRGRILGDGGAVIVTDRPVYRFGIDKTRLNGADAAASARRLAQLVNVDPAKYAQRVAAAGPKAFVEAVTLRAGDPALPTAAERRAVPGAVAIQATASLAPTRTFARPLLGSVGEATAEIVEQSGGRISAGSQTGLSGLQRSFNDVLAGLPAVQVQAVQGTARRELFQHGGQAGRALTLTLNVVQQRKAEAALAGVTPASAIVAIRPSTGEIVAAASGTGGKGVSTATQGRYAPGSTFKLVTTLAMLRRGSTPTSTVPCTTTSTVDGRVFRNYSDFPATGLGGVSLREALAKSCNTAFISQAGSVPQGALTEAAASLGLGREVNLGVPSYSGEVPDTASSQTEHAASMIGQGKILASPLGMATVAASIAAGRVVTPRLVAPPATPAAPSATSTASGPALTAAEASTLRSMMRDVVTRGTGSVLRDAGPAVMAKSGTAEYGTANPPRTHAWMVAIDGDLAVSVLVADGESGSRTGGPIMRRFLQ